MKKETPRSLKREAGLANGLTTIAPDAGSLLWGGTKGKAQSEREKRGPRHTDPGVASSSRSLWAGSRHRVGTSRRLGSGLQDRGRHGNGLAPLRRAGAVHPMPSDNSHQPATTFLSTTTDLKILRIATTKNENGRDLKMYDGQIVTPIKATVMEVLRAVARASDVTVDDLKAACRKRVYSAPRQVAAYLCRELTDASYPRIASLMGGRDHTTALFAYRKIAGMLRDNRPGLAPMLDRLSAEILAEAAARHKREDAMRIAALVSALARKVAA